jgi:flavin reductase (DIM6/NTAB) family NADH-FMN oxidoreductase RutF
VSEEFRHTVDPAVFRHLLGPTVPTLLTTLYPGGLAELPRKAGRSPSTSVVMNVAPASWVQKVSYSPPMVMVSLKPEGDTLRNLLEVSKWFGLNVPMLDYCQDTVLCGQKLPYKDTELYIDGVRFEPWKHAVHPVMLLDKACQWAVCAAQKVERVGDHVVVFAAVLDAFALEGWEKVPLYVNRTEFAHVGERFEVEGY